MMQLNLTIAWLGILLGVIAGAALGLGFHEPQWLGGYASWTRRLVRLGHIAFFGIAGLNIAFAFTAAHLPSAPLLTCGSYALAAANLLMPGACFLAAWRPALRRLFPLPVACVLLGVVSVVVPLLQGTLT